MSKAGFFLIEDTLGELFIPAEVLGRAKRSADQEAIKILADAKENAPWQDRTGAARAGLGVEVDIEGDEVVISLFHSVDYGIWLETIQSGEYAIIMPTLEKYAAEVFDATSAIQTGEDLP